MLENIKAVIFDLDGTLVDSMWMWKSIDVEYLGKKGIAVPEDIQAFQEELEGMGFTETAVFFKNRFHIEDSLEEIKKKLRNILTVLLPAVKYQTANRRRTSI